MFALLLVAVGTTLVSGDSCRFAVNGYTYDFSSLATAPVLLPDGALPSVFKYHLQFCQNLRTRCDELSGKSEIGNFYQTDVSGSSCYQVLSNWTSPISVNAISRGISLMWHNGDICQGSPLVTRMDITCNNNVAGINGTVVKNPSNSCEYIATLQSKIACSSPPSTCTLAGKDLSPLKGQTIIVNDNNVIDQFAYYISFCGDIATGCRNRITGQMNYGNFYQEQRGSGTRMCYGVGSKWIMSQMQATYANNMLTITSHNGDMCGGSPRSVTIYMMCKPGATVVTGYAHVNGCSYTAHLFSQYVC